MYYKFTDNEYGVIVDSLAKMRDELADADIATPNIDSALAKLGKWADPSGCEFLVLTGQDMWLILGANGDPDYDEAKYQAARERERA
jgi:hypothetical protein